MNRRFAFISALSMALPCVMVASTVHAAAFYISEIGSPGSLATAGVANTTNNFGADYAFTNSAKLQWDNPQLMEVGMRYQLDDEWSFLANADWEDWSEFSENFLFVQGGTLDPSAALDRERKDTWHADIAVLRKKANKAYSMGLSYDSSPVSDGKRTEEMQQ